MGFDELDRRLARLQTAVRVIEESWRSFKARSQAQVESALRRVVSSFVLARARQQVEARVSGKLEKFRKLRAYAERKRGQEIRLEELQLAFSKLSRVIEAVLVARLNFGLYMLKEHRDPLFASMLLGPDIPKHSILSADFEDAPRRHKLQVFPKYLDAYHALIFKNFRHVGRSQGAHEMAVQFSRFVTKARVFYKLIALHNDSC